MLSIIMAVTCILILEKTMYYISIALVDKHSETVMTNVDVF